MMHSPPARNRVKRPDVRRDELLAAARALLLESDIADVTVVAITQAAGAAKGTFYRYFKSKEELLIVLRMEFVRHLVERVEDDLAPIPVDDMRARVDALVAASIHFQAENERLHTVLFHQLRAADVIDRGDPPEQQHLVSVLTQFIEQGNAAGVFTVASPTDTARLLYHALNGAADEAAKTASTRDVKRMINAAAEAVWRVLTSAS